MIWPLPRSDMTESGFRTRLLVVLVACTSLLAVALFFAVAVNSDLAVFVNPHGEFGWIGLMLGSAVSLLATCALFLSLPPVLLTLLRSPAARSPGRISLAVIASLVFLVFATMFASSLVSALSAA
jgi:hypothetical protein